MRQPFWILNSALLLMLLVVIVFVFFKRVKIPPKQSIEPYEISVEKKEISEKVNLEIIYKNDLFDTYKPVIIVPKKEAEETIPEPPSHIETLIPETYTPQFFDPLAITLTGIITDKDDKRNRAIIMDNKTQQQVNYKVNDEIEDAQIVRILNDKVILVRSNGQQEVLYLRQSDAQYDNPMQKTTTIKNIAKKISEFNYIVDPVRFINYVKTLGNLIDLFDLSTAYSQGQSVGSKIGNIEDNSLGMQMGLMPGDIIEKINDISADTTSSRFNIYKNIISKETDTITVELLRDNDPIAITYKLKKIEPIREKVTEGKTFIDKFEEKTAESEKLKILKEKYKFAPTIEEIRSREMQNMFKRKDINLKNNI